ncbi:hypothetical protein M885DRAFT_476453 [Pelagophyceae sp. CCMP2097]|nr:hypothetical protein M885DRAFT_476453 [Pelagophyceae sp. CCMP2097]
MLYRAALLAGAAQGFGPAPARFGRAPVAKATSTSTSTATMFDSSRKVLELQPSCEIGNVAFTKYPISEEAGALPREKVLYLPGIEFLGISSGAQLEGLVASGYEPWFAAVNGETDRSTFDGLSASVAELLKVWTTGDASARPLVIGESFGGLLAADVATRLRETEPDVFAQIRGFVLINPATSYDRTAWSGLGIGGLVAGQSGNAYAAAIGAAIGLLASDDSMVAKSTSEFSRFDFSSLASAVDGAQALAKLVPPATLMWRVDNWLDVGCRRVNDRLWRLRKPLAGEAPGFLLVAGAEDRFLPSRSEVRRLAKELPVARTEVVVLPAGGHALLVDAERMDLSAMLRDSDALYGAEKRAKKAKKAQSSVDDFVPPTAAELAETRKGVVDPLRRLVSPVFLSRKSADSPIERGLGAVLLPSDTGGPVLLVGNHQLFGLDLPLLVDQFIAERDTLIRGLAHPVATNAIDALTSSAPRNKASERRANAAWWKDAADVRGGNATQDRTFFEKFGAVQVTPRNFVRLMQKNEAALLFPGGVRESNHGKNEAHKLFWPSGTAEFARVAAKFNATIIPFGAVGAADSFEILRDKDDPLPFLGGANAAASIPSARKWANVTEDFRFPLAVPSPRGPARMYFLFQPPVSTADVDASDRAACAEVYENVKLQVEDAMETLLRARQRDPFERPLQRLAYEAAPGLAAVAPTFPVDATLDNS